MRILFLHTAYERLTPEYQVHINLIKHTPKSRAEALFLWQTPTPEHVLSNDHWQTVRHDFGRNMSITPPPSHKKRGLMLLKQYPSSLRTLRRTAAQFQPDLIYTSQQKYDMHFAKVLSASLRIPHVIHAHYTIGPWLGEQVLRDIQKSSRLVTVSEFIRQNALLYGVNHQHAHTIPNTIDFQQFAEPEDPRRQLTQFDWKEDNQVIITVGRLDPGKGHVDLLKAFARVVQAAPNARLLICGTPSSDLGYQTQLEELTQQLSIGSFVHFAGHRTDISKLLRCADVFCLPSTMEPFGLVYLEAMAAKLPVVAYHSGGVPEIVTHEKTGLLSYPNNTPELANNLITLLRDPEYAAQLGQAGFERATREFNPTKIAARWIDLVQTLATR